MQGFKVDIQYSGNIVILQLSGYLDAHTSAILDEELSNLLKENMCHIVANCEALEYISSAGLGVFMSYIEQVRKKKGDIKLANLNQKIFKIFELVGFTKLYEICDSTDTALKNFCEKSGSKQCNQGKL